MESVECNCTLLGSRSDALQEMPPDAPGFAGEETLPPLRVEYRPLLASDWCGALSHSATWAVVPAYLRRLLDTY